VKLLVNAAFATGIRVGVSVYLREIVTRLARMCDVTVLTSEEPQFRSLGCRTIRIPHWSRSLRGRFLWELLRLRGASPPDYDVLLCPTPVAPPLPRLPVISVVHDLTPLVCSRLHGARFKTAFWLNLQTLRWASRVAVDSENTRVDLTRLRILPDRRVAVVPAAPGLRPVAAAGGFARTYGRFVLHVGGHIPTKNVPRLVAAFSRLADQELRLLLVGWGAGDQLARTKRAVERFGLGGRVVMLTDLPGPALSDLYANCQLFVFPSLYEGFGMPVLEAMAHGAPVACSVASSLPEIAGDAALYFDPLSVTEIVDRMRTLLDSRRLASTMQERGLARAAGYTWENTAASMYRLAMSAIRRAD
jgi:glycosyltransferase involved in cell wall biosynthesis